ncbi:MAG: type I restriction-modification enzyme R subunit C-terminal domain-containing protein [Bacillota bacterium]|nr:type I restriction-modification enzyme R subunit C-terminal domain-containing protein [Bacillota bacterium]
MSTTQFTDEQQTWLAYIKEHLIENLAIAEEDFEIMPVFERHGGLIVAKKVFGDDFNLLINKINESLAA